YVLLNSVPPVPSLLPYTTLFRSPLGYRARDASGGPPKGRFGAPRDPVGGRSRHLVSTGRGSARGGPVGARGRHARARREHGAPGDRKSTRLNSSHGKISYAVFCL